MGFYPMVDYVGGFKGMTDQLNAGFQDIRDAERQKALIEDMRAQADYRSMIAEKLREDIADKKMQREAMAGFMPYIEQNKHLLQPTEGVRTGMDPNPPIGGAVEAFPGTMQEKFTEPPKETLGSLAGKYFMGKNMPEKGFEMMLKSQESQDKIYKEQADVFQKLIGKAVETGNNELLQNMVKAAKDGKNPYLNEMFAPIEGVKIVGKQVETTVTKEFKEGQLKDPIDGTPMPPGKYTVTFLAQPGNPQSAQIKKIEEAKADKEAKASVYDDYAKGGDARKTAESYMKLQKEADPMSIMAKNMEQDRKDREEERRNREEKEKINERREKNVKEYNEILESPKSYEEDGRTKRRIEPGDKLKKSQLDRINLLRRNNGEPELEEVVEQVEDKENSGWFSKKTKPFYQYVPKKTNAPVQPPAVNKPTRTTSGLSGVPTSALLALAKQRGIA